jgi:hypothetical protein
VAAAYPRIRTAIPSVQRQLYILRWIDDGCPDRDWPDFTHKTTASALAGRGLVIVRCRAKRWEATITDNDGRYYLDHGAYTGQVIPVPRCPSNMSAAEWRVIEPELPRRRRWKTPSAGPGPRRSRRHGSVSALCQAFHLYRTVLSRNPRNPPRARGTPGHPAHQSDPIIPRRW